METFLIGFAEKQKDSTCGCFIQNAVVEHAGENEQVLQRSDALFDTLQTAIVQTIKSAQNQAQISSKQDAKSLGQFVICQMQGMRVLGKAKRYTEIDTATQILIQYLKSA